MKRIAVLLFALFALCLCLCGCGDYGPSMDEIRNEAYLEGSKEGFDDGYKSGYDDGYDDGLDEGYDKGYDKGYDDGAYDGYDEGYNDGYKDGLDDGIKEASTPAPAETPFEIPDLEWQDTPESTAFSRIGYADGENVLGVVFRNSDPRMYLYFDFPQSEWESFRSAESWGGYYNQHIKGQYESKRID